MHRQALCLFTVLITILTYTTAQSLVADYNDRSCNPSGVRYIVSGRSELLGNIARKCGYDVKRLQKDNINAHHGLEKGAVISLPCPLGLEARYHNKPAESNVNQFKSFSSSHRLGQNPRGSKLETARNTEIQDPGFIGCGICGNKYEPGVGHTIKSVAQYCNTTEGELRKMNPSLTNESVATFQAINIPCNGTDYINNCGICGSWHRIRPEETMFNLAKSCNISLEVLGQANTGIDLNHVYPGQYINIPCMNPNLIIPLDHCGSCGIEQNLLVEENIENVSKRCSVNSSDLLVLNPSVQGQKIPIGSKLRLPCGQDNCGPCGSWFTTLDNEQIGDVAAKCHVGTIALQIQNKHVNFGQLPNNTKLEIPCNTNHIENPPCGECSPFISLKSGIDVNGIANMCNVSIDVIKYANSIRSENEIMPRGKRMYVPCASVPLNTQRSCTICGASIKLRAFVKIDDLAVLCNTTRDDIKEVNSQGVVLDKPGVGDTLMLPCNNSNSGCGPCGISYIVTDETESLQSVAVKCATMAEDIQSANPDVNFTEGVPIDTIIGIPCSSLDMVSGSGYCGRCPGLLQRPANILILILFYKPLMVFVFTLFILVM